MAKIGSGSKPPIDIEGGLVTFKERSLSLYQKRGLFAKLCSILMEDDLSSPSKPTDRRTRDACNLIHFARWRVIQEMDR